MTRAALDLWSELERTGMVLCVQDGRLSVTPASLLTDVLRGRIRAALPDLIALVVAAPTPDQQAYLDAQPPPDFANYGNSHSFVALVERHGGPLTHDDAPDPVSDVTEEAQRDLFRSPTMTHKKHLYADEPCDRTEGHEDVYAAWQRLFGEPFDRAKAIRVDDDGDSFAYHMPNGHALTIACDGHYID